MVRDPSAGLSWVTLSRTVLRARPDDVELEREIDGDKRRWNISDGKRGELR